MVHALKLLGFKVKAWFPNSTQGLEFPLCWEFFYATYLVKGKELEIIINYIKTSSYKVTSPSRAWLQLHKCPLSACLLDRFLAYLLACLLACQSASLLAYLPACLLACLLSFFLACRHACLLDFLLSCFLTCLLAYMLACLLACLVAYLTYLLACLLTYLLACPKTI